MRTSRVRTGLMGALCALAPLALALSATDAAAPRNAKRSVSLARYANGGIGTFTPAAADPRRARMSLQGFGGAGGGDSGFRFTPAAAPGRSRAVTVAIRARTNVPTLAERAITPAAAFSPVAYNLGVGIGWKRFALSGDYARLESSILPDSREAVDLGLSYNARRWSTRLQLGADRSIGDRPIMIGSDQSYALDLGGSYAVSQRLELTGGLRYKTQRDRLVSLSDGRRDSQAVYVGTAFRF